MKARKAEFKQLIPFLELQQNGLYLLSRDFAILEWHALALSSEVFHFGGSSLELGEKL